jgi:hypothetical protein
VHCRPRDRDHGAAGTNTEHRKPGQQHRYVHVILADAVDEHAHSGMVETPCPIAEIEQLDICFKLRAVGEGARGGQVLGIAVNAA